MQDVARIALWGAILYVYFCFVTSGLDLTLSTSLGRKVAPLSLSAIVFPLVLYLTVVWGAKAAWLEQSFDFFVFITGPLSIEQSTCLSESESKEDKSKSRQTEAWTHTYLPHQHVCQLNTLQNTACIHYYPSPHLYIFPVPLSLSISVCPQQAVVECN